MGVHPFDLVHDPRQLSILSPLIPVQSSQTSTRPSSAPASAPSGTPSSLSPSITAASSPSSAPVTSRTSISSDTKINPSDLSVSVHTSTVIVQSSPSATPSDSSNTSNSSFLQNRVASGLVFAVVGSIGLALIIFVATFFLRRRRNRKLLKEAVSFDPVVVDSEEKEMGSSIGHGNIGREVKPPTFGSHYNPTPPPGGYGPYPVAQPRGSPALYDNTR